MATALTQAGDQPFDLCRCVRCRSCISPGKGPGAKPAERQQLARIEKMSGSGSFSIDPVALGGRSISALERQLPNERRRTMCGDGPTLIARKMRNLKTIHADATCPVLLRKINRFTPCPNQIHKRRRPAPLRGAFRDRHGRWAKGCGGRLGAFDEWRVRRTAKSCGPDAPTLASSFVG